MKKSKRVLSLACAAVMLSAIVVPASAETFAEQQGDSIALIRESADVQQLQARNYKKYGYTKLVTVSSNGSAKTLVQGNKSGSYSSVAEHVVETLRNVDTLDFRITVAKETRTDWYTAGEEEFYMEYKYDGNQGYTGTAALQARNFGKNTARVKGKIQFN